MDSAAWIAVFGRLHPMLLHMPIGFLIAIAFVEMLALARRGAPAPAALVRLNALLGVITVVSGLLLAREPGYDDDALFWHKWLGIVVAAGGILLAILDARRRRPSGGAGAFRGALLVVLALVMIGGHLGASVTHGEDFVLGPLHGAVERGPARTPVGEMVGDSAGAPTSAPNAVAVLQRACIGCHSESKHKGGLSVVTVADILKGGGSGPMIVPGKPNNSDIMRRLRLPADDDDHMPPKKKPQLTAAEVGLIEAWIAAGANADGVVTAAIAAGASQPAPVRDANAAPASVSERKPATAEIGAASDEPPAAPAAALQALQDALVHVSPIAQESKRLVVDFTATRGRLNGAELAQLLEPITDQVVDLNLARCKLSDELLKQLMRCHRLTRLTLRGTDVTDAQIGSIAKLPALAELNIALTGVGDAGLQAVAALATLKELTVWKTAISPAALDQFRAAHPQVQLEAGDHLETEALETESDIKLTEQAAPPVAAAALKPANTCCPITGKPLDPRYQILYEGKVIGFCCPNCPKEFWADPAKYLATLK